MYKYDITEIENDLKQMLEPYRYRHTLGTRDTIIKLAQYYKVDQEKAVVAALLHDYAKNFTSEDMISFAKEHNIHLTDIKIKYPELVHGEISAVIAKEKYKADDDIVQAIKYHVTGNITMDMLSKILFVADMIEPTRDFDGIDALRGIAYEDLDMAIIATIDRTIKYLTGKGALIDPLSLNARNHILMRRPELIEKLKSFYL